MTSRGGEGSRPVPVPRGDDNDDDDDDNTHESTTLRCCAMAAALRVAIALLSSANCSNVSTAAALALACIAKSCSIDRLPLTMAAWRSGDGCICDSTSCKVALSVIIRWLKFLISSLASKMRWLMEMDKALSSASSCVMLVACSLTLRSDRD